MNLSAVVPHIKFQIELKLMELKENEEKWKLKTKDEEIKIIFDKKEVRKRSIERKCNKM